MSEAIQNAEVLSSVEYALWQHLERVNSAYIAMTNPESKIQTKDDLKGLYKAATDMEQQIHKILCVWQSPPAQIRNVNDRVAPNLDAFWINSAHFYQRFVMCKAEHKAKHLTALYYLVRDLAEAAKETKVERYYR